MTTKNHIAARAIALTQISHEIKLVKLFWQQMKTLADEHNIIAVDNPMIILCDTGKHFIAIN
jgi:predicted DNA-binding ribbon-helix-helix protein